MTQSKAEKRPAGCLPKSCDRLHTADSDLRAWLSRKTGEPPNKFVRNRFVARWCENGRMCSSTAFPCVGQVEQWVGEHLLPHLLKHKIEAKAEIVLETSFTVWERIAVREIKTDSRPKKRRK